MLLSFVPAATQPSSALLAPTPPAPAPPVPPAPTGPPPPVGLPPVPLDDELEEDDELDDELEELPLQVDEFSHSLVQALSHTQVKMAS